MRPSLKPWPGRSRTPVGDDYTPWACSAASRRRSTAGSRFVFSSPANGFIDKRPIRRPSHPNGRRKNRGVRVLCLGEMQRRQPSDHPAGRADDSKENPIADQGRLSGRNRANSGDRPRVVIPFPNSWRIGPFPSVQRTESSQPRPTAWVRTTDELCSLKGCDCLTLGLSPCQPFRLKIERSRGFPGRCPGLRAPSPSD